MTVDLLSMLAGALLSLLFSYLPGLRRWYDSLGAGDDPGEAGVKKRLVMLALLVLVASGSYALSCAGLAPLFLPEATPALTCDTPGLAGLLKVLLLALVANQGAYLITPPASRRRPPAAPTLTRR